MKKHPLYLSIFASSVFFFFQSLVVKTMLLTTDDNRIELAVIVLALVTSLMAINRMLAFVFVDDLVMIFIKMAMPNLNTDFIRTFRQKHIFGTFILGISFILMALVIDIYAIYDLFSPEEIIQTDNSSALANLFFYVLMNIFFCIPFFIAYKSYQECKRILISTSSLEVSVKKEGFEVKEMYKLEQLYPTIIASESDRRNVYVKKITADASIAIFNIVQRFGKNGSLPISVIKLEFQSSVPFFYFGREVDEFSEYDAIQATIDMLIRPRKGDMTKINLNDVRGGKFELIVEKEIEIEGLQIFTQEVLDEIGEKYDNLVYGGFGNAIYIFGKAIETENDFQFMYALAKYFLEKVHMSGITRSMYALRERGM